ncbi:MAG: hypothetical protein PHQ74_02130 [Crocinitomicaceae bacterium]|nr:hypothetical protein [Crocinitomicaceae bacterium]
MKEILQLRILKFLILVFSFSPVLAQQKSIPLNSFYKEKFIENSGGKSIETFYPANESQINLPFVIRDSTLQYYEFTEWLFKKHWLNIQKEEGTIMISPFMNIALGKETSDPNKSRLFNNTRGLYVEGSLLKKFSFNFIFAENQNRFMNYEANYFKSRGELYVGSNAYSLQNAFVPGGARTKPFKGDGFDYAYSIGSLAYQVNTKLRIELGNNQHFIGSGYRSLLLSDNSAVSPNFKVKWNFLPKWRFDVLFQKNNNLYRKPRTKAVESPYETKLFALSYLTFKPTENFSISLFTAGNQLRGDSLIRHGVEWQMLIPIPLVQNDALFGDSKKFNGITGLNLDLALNKTRLYGQVVLDKMDKKYLVAGQLGVHFFEILKVKNLHAQVEFNYVPEHFYSDVNPKLSYSNSNIPLAHPKGNNFGEGVLRLDYEYQRFYIQSSTILYGNLGGNDSIPFSANSIFLNTSTTKIATPNTIVQSVELGWRVNRRYNAQFFIAWKGRAYNSAFRKESDQMILVGFKTGITNSYFDF